jgi:RNA polymerase sigma-70 factor (ECF subfamily)
MRERMKTDSPLREEESDLIERIRQGDAESYRVLVERYQDSLMGFLFNLLKDRELAREFAQDAFVKAYKGIRNFENRRDARFSTWLFTIARNAFLDLRRREKRRIEEEVQEDMPELTIEAEQDRHVQDARIRKALDKGLGKLNEKMRTSFELTMVQGFSYEEAAVVLKTSVPVIRHRVHRTRVHLKSLLKGFLEGP